jgi:RNA polymerase sigma factor (sigma-70 family)
MAILPKCQSKGTASFACAQAGCADCMHALLKEHEGLVHACIHWSEFGGIPYTDAAQEGRIGLWRAILHYDPNRQVAFSTFAWRRIWGCIWRYTVRFGQKGEELQEEPYEACHAALAEAAWEQAQIAEALNEALHVLPKRLRDILEQYYGLNGRTPMNLEAIGQEMSITRERVRQLRNQGLVWLRLPALSIRLRSLCDRNSHQDYIQARRLNEAWLSRGRRRK